MSKYEVTIVRCDLCRRESQELRHQLSPWYYLYGGQKHLCSECFPTFKKVAEVMGFEVTYFEANLARRDVFIQNLGLGIS